MGGTYANMQHVCQILALFQGSLGQSQAVQIYATFSAGTVPNRPIGVATPLPGIKGKVSPSLG